MDHFVVELDDPKRDDVRSLLEQHLDFARKVTPPEDVHALDLLAVAAERGVRRVSLETRAGEAFEPARSLYAGVGFVPCGPFGDYEANPNSAFMTRFLG